MKSFLNHSRNQFIQYKNLADKSIITLSQSELHFKPSENSNSIAALISHLSGNMRSRWKNTLSSDGEKPDRIRELEFLCPSNLEKDDLIFHWEMGWKCLFEALDSFKENDLTKTIYIRSEPLSLLEGIQRQITHYAYHIGQIIFIAKIIKGKNVQNKSIPKYRTVLKGSIEFNTRNSNL